MKTGHHRKAVNKITMGYSSLYDFLKCTYFYNEQAKRILYKRKSLNKYEREYILHNIIVKKIKNHKRKSKNIFNYTRVPEYPKVHNFVKKI